MLTEKQILKHDHIPTEEIEKDIKDTQLEIDQFNKEIRPLRDNPVVNKMEIYIREGKISSRQEFMGKLNEILEYRKKK